MTLTGGCLCGAVRFETDHQPQFVRHCHCIFCRKVTGAAFVTGLMYRAADVRWTGQTGSVESSPGIVRVFCPTCSSSLAFREIAIPEKDVLMLGAFDDPTLIEPGQKVEHVFAERELPWLHVEDGFDRSTGQPMGLYKVT